jgi:hypothetical protein
MNCSLIGELGSKYIDPRFPEEICLPSLKNLKLDIWDVDIDIVNDFLFGCPILETLDICLFSFTSCAIYVEEVENQQQCWFRF